MRCRNCGHTGCLVLLVELAVLASPPDRFTDPDWALSLECPACASTDVAGDPASLLAARTR